MGILKLIDVGLSPQPTAGTTTYNASGKAAAGGQFSITATTKDACITDTKASVSVQIKKSSDQYLYVYSSRQCSGLVGTVSEGDAGTAKADDNNPTLRGIATQINALDTSS